MKLKGNHIQMALLLFQTDVKTLRASENAPIFLTSLANCRSVHNWQKFLHIIDQKLVKQPFIPLLEIHHGHVSLKRNFILA
jgi:hypothetical protein